MAETGNPEYTTVLGPDAVFKGEMTFDKGMRLQGKLSGTITSPGRLHVAQGATMEANVEAGAIILEGAVQGNLTAQDRVEMKPSTKYEGDLTASKLVVEEGAQFRGHVSVGPDAVKSRPPQAGVARLGQTGGQLGANLPPAQPQGQPLK